MKLYEELTARGLIAQATHPEEIKDLLNNGQITFYTGFDPTADSLHVGSFLQLVAMKHLQNAGHRPIALLGGATAMIGDPTGRTDMRRVMSVEEINSYVEVFKQQFARYIDFTDDKAIMVNNADWLTKLNYIDVLRDIGPHFSVNRMLTAECFKSRLEVGLSFTEFNYMIMQGYDFLTLNDKYDCILQLGGDDQWSNIIGGMELVRRCRGKKAYGMTFSLLTTSDGVKMGKTQKGAVWLDSRKTSPYDLYQYWRNVEDARVINCLKMLTFIPLEEIAELEQLTGSELNKAKKLLAHEITKMVHDKQAADEAQATAEALFENSAISDNMPSFDVTEAEVNGMTTLDLLLKGNIVPSKAEGRRLISQNGITFNDVKLSDANKTLTTADFGGEGYIVIRKGKKAYYKAILK